MLDIGIPQFMRHNNGTLEFVPDGSTVAATLDNTSLDVNFLRAYSADTELGLQGKVTSDGSAIACKIGNETPLTSSGDKIVSFYSDNFISERAFIDKDGNASFEGQLSFNGQLFFNGVEWLRTTDGINVKLGYYSGSASDSVNLGGYSNTANTASVTAVGSNSARNNTGVFVTAMGAYSLSGEAVSLLGSSGLGHGSGQYSIAQYSLFLGYLAGRYIRRNNTLVVSKDENIPLIYGEFDNKILCTVGDHEIIDPDTIAGESLSETDFSTHANWNVTGSITDNTGAAVCTGAGTLTQPSGSMTISGVANSWYIFEYTISGKTTPAAATITTSFASEAVTLAVNRNATHKVFFKSAVSPGDFVISASAGNFTLDDVSLKRITGGDLKVWGHTKKSVEAGFTVGTGGQGTGVITNQDVIEIDTANSNDDVTLPAAEPGLTIIIANNSGNTIQLWPASGDNLGAGVDTAVTLATANRAQYIGLDTTNWQVI